MAANLGPIAIAITDVVRFADEHVQWSSAEQYSELSALTRLLAGLLSEAARKIPISIGDSINYLHKTVDAKVEQLATEYEQKLASCIKEAAQAAAKLDGMSSQVAAIRGHRDELQSKISYLTARTAFDPGVRDRVFAMTNGRCFYCDTELVVAGPALEDGAAKVMHIDHLVPKSAGGPDHITNYVPACGPCNTAKNGRPYLEFIRDRHPRLKLVSATQGGSK